MKLRITDVRQVIREIIAEAMPNFERTFKYPSKDEQARLQREFGGVLSFDYCVTHPQAEDFFTIWVDRRFNDLDRPLLYFVTSLDVKDVHSTMDDGFAILVASLSYSSPFDKPVNHEVVAYGPKEAMKQVIYTIRAQLYEGQNTGDMTAFTNNYLKNTGFYTNVGEWFYRSMMHVIRRKKIKAQFGPNKMPSEMIITFYNYDDINPTANEAMIELKRKVLREYPEINVKLTFESHESGLRATFINKYSGFILGRINFYNVIVRYYTGPMAGGEPGAEWDQGIINYGEEPF